MKILKFNYAAVVCFSIVLSSCGGGGGKSPSVPVDNEVVPSAGDESELEKVLPFGLDKTDGGIAASFGFFAKSIAVGGVLATKPVIPSLIESVDYDGPQDDLEHPIIINQFKKKECVSGSVNYSENVPTTPIRLGVSNDTSWPNLTIFQLNASRCRLGGADGFVDGMASGQFSIEKNEATNYEKLTLSKEYHNYAYGHVYNLEGASVEGFNDKMLNESLVHLTGSVISESTVNGSTSSDFFREITENTYQYQSEELVVRNLLFKISRDGGFHTGGYNVRWKMGETGAGHRLVTHDEVITLVGLGSEQTFPKGDYNLRVVVTSPLVSGDDNGFLWLVGGSATIDLKSHDIKADVVYHQGYADVTYYNPVDGIKQVRINADLSSKDLLEER